MESIAIRLNGEAADVQAGWRLTDLLTSLGRDPRTVAIERNGEILPRASYGETELLAGDQLEIVQFVQGG